MEKIVLRMQLEEPMAGRPFLDMVFAMHIIKYNEKIRNLLPIDKIIDRLIKKVIKNMN